MNNKELLKIVGYFVLICLSFFVAARYYFEDNKICTICWIVIGGRNLYDLVRRIKNSKKEDYERNSDTHSLLRPEVEDKLIKNIIKDMESNRTLDEISERNLIEIKLVEEILQIYSTHPGIGVDGIMDRIKE